MGLLLVSVSCVSSPEGRLFQRYYDEIDHSTRGSSTYYRWMVPGSRRLIVYLEGSGLYSVLGTEEKGRLDSYTVSYVILDAWKDSADILIPEKPGMHKGGQFYGDASVLASYTVEDHASSHARGIDDHLSRYQYDEVFLVGFSEGGALLPAVYEAMERKGEITGLVAVGAGVMNQYDEFILLAESPLTMNDQYRNGLSHVAEAREKIMQDPESIEKWYLGWPYRRWSSYFSYTPANLYRDVPVPVLFLHGEKDTSSPVESSLAANSLGLSNCTVITYPEMGHGPDTDEQRTRLFTDITEWFAGVGTGVTDR